MLRKHSQMTDFFTQLNHASYPSHAVLEQIADLDRTLDIEKLDIEKAMKRKTSA